MYHRDISMIKGDTLAFSVKLKDLDQDLSSAYFTCRKTYNSEVVFQKTLNGGITKDLTEENTYNVRVAPEDTDPLIAGLYRYDLEIGANGDKYTIMHGILYIQQDITYLPVLVSIAVSFNPGANTFTHTEVTLSDLKQYLGVYKVLNNGATEKLADADYTLTGDLNIGSNTITVTHSEKTATFSVKVLPLLSSITATFTPGSQTFVNQSVSLTDLKSYLSVVANYEDETTENIASNAYELSGNLNIGDNTITVTYKGETATFVVNVLPRLSSISASFNPGSNTFVEGEVVIDDLRSFLTVTATYEDNTTKTVTDYEMSGTLIKGTHRITVYYEDKENYFSVTIAAPETTTAS